MKRAIRDRARQMRKDGASIRSIATALHVSKGSVSSWVRDIQLEPSQIDALRAKQRQFDAQNAGALANAEKYRAIRRIYQEEGRKKAQAMRLLHMAGCMLYWAEGAKTRNAVYFVNSDADMMLFFARFLREEMSISDQEMTVYIHCHSSEPDEIRRIEQFWLALLQLPSTALRKTQVKKGSESSRHVLINGVCGLRVNKSRIVQHIFGAIQEYAGFDKPEWLG